MEGAILLAAVDLSSSGSAHADLFSFSRGHLNNKTSLRVRVLPATGPALPIALARIATAKVGTFQARLIRVVLSVLLE
jgi:hypothetical protein